MPRVRVSNKALALAAKLGVPVEQLRDRLAAMKAENAGIRGKDTYRALAERLTQETGVPVDDSWLVRYMRPPS